MAQPSGGGPGMVNNRGAAPATPDGPHGGDARPGHGCSGNPRASCPGPIPTAADVRQDVRADVPVPVAVMFGGSTWKHNRPGLTTRPAASGHDPASGSPGVTVTAWGGKILSARRATVPARSSPPRPRSTSGPPAVRPVSLSPSTCACPSPVLAASLSPRPLWRRVRPGLVGRHFAGNPALPDPVSPLCRAPCSGPSSGG